VSRKGRPAQGERTEESQTGGSDVWKALEGCAIETGGTKAKEDMKRQEPFLN